jgi:hypothetical protein
VNNFLWYLSWIPFVTFLYFLQSWLTVQNNIHGGRWFWIFFGVSLFTPWVIISKFSKDVVSDALVFDVILVLSYTIGLLYFSNSISKFGFSQWFGIFTIVLGMFIFKKGI